MPNIFEHKAWNDREIQEEVLDMSQTYVLTISTIYRRADQIVWIILKS